MTRIKCGRSAVTPIRKASSQIFSQVRDNLGRNVRALIGFECGEFYVEAAFFRRLQIFHQRCSETTAMHSQSRYGAGRTGRPRSRGRVAGDKGEHRHQSQFDNPAECRVREPGGNGSGLGGRRQSRWLRTAGGFAVASCWAVHKRRTFREQRRCVQGRSVLNALWRASIEDQKATGNATPRP